MRSYRNRCASRLFGTRHEDVASPLATAIVTNDTIKNLLKTLNLAIKNLL